MNFGASVASQPIAITDIVWLSITWATATQPPLPTAPTTLALGHLQSSLTQHLPPTKAATCLPPGICLIPPGRDLCGKHPHLLLVLAYSPLTYQSSERFLSQEKCWHLHDYLVDTLGPYVINVIRAAIAGSQQGTMAMGTFPGDTQDSCKPFCTCSQMEAEKLGSPSAATVTAAGLALPTRIPGLRLGQKKQHKARNHLPQPSCPHCHFSVLENSVPLLFYLA